MSAVTQIKDGQINPQIDLCFKNIKFKLQSQKQQKIILDGVSGIFFGSQITAIIGSSGSGKTTLLDILAYRLNCPSSAQISGQLTANHQPYNFYSFNQFASYVIQDDIMLETYTPREAFQFAASFRYKNVKVVEEKVNDMIKCMMLEKCQNTNIGGEKNPGISGGERKRTQIGFDLISDPECILLDEPTSGLDSFTAFQIINYLKQLAKNRNKTVILTLHQPSTDIMNLLDRIILLTQGRFIYQGPQENIINYFDTIGYQCPISQNPMDYFMDLMNQKDQNQIDYLFDRYDNLLLPQVLLDIENERQEPIKFKSFQAGFCKTLEILTLRAFRHYFRHPNFFKARIIVVVFQSLLLGAVFWNVGNNNGSLASLFSLTGSLFFQCVVTAFNQTLGCIMIIASEKDVIQKEFNSNIYTPLIYFIARQLLELPLITLTTPIQVVIFYYMMGLNNDPIIIVNAIIIQALLALSFNSLGLMAGCFFKDSKMGLSIGPMILMPLIIFGGLLANYNTFPQWIGWIQYLSPIKYGFEAFVTNEVQGRDYDVDPIKQYNFKIGLYECMIILLAFTTGMRLLSLKFIQRIQVKFDYRMIQ